MKFCVNHYLYRIHFVKTFVFLILVISSLCMRGQAVLSCNAGADMTLCPAVSGQLAGTVTGGKAPYSYHWEPAGLCTNANALTTSITIQSSTNFTLTVTDSTKATCTDVVAVYMDDFKYFGAGDDKFICYLNGSPVTIGDVDNHTGAYTFSWTPTSDLSDPSIPNPVATPSVTTIFTVTITSASCGVMSDQVTVSVYKIDAYAGEDTTIDEGQTIVLHASGGVQYYWYPGGLSYPNTATPEVNPTTTSTYLLQAVNEYGCSGYDNVTVEVRPYDGLFFYNTFTPNGDGQNDYWVIPNLLKYPDNKLEIYNRYGQLIYKKTGYENDWQGRYLGEELPAGTYYFYLDTNAAPGKYKGSVTIVR
jgi:gliding motility-associated-like protein